MCICDTNSTELFPKHLLALKIIRVRIFFKEIFNLATSVKFLSILPMKYFESEDRKLVIDILVDAFEGNKSVDFVVGNSRKNRKVLMEYSLENCLENGDVFISDSGNSCVLIKYSYQKKKPLKLLWWDVKLALSGIGVSNIRKVLERESSIEKTQPEEPFVYVWFIGVSPSHQGKGEGSEAMKFVSDLAKEKGLPICLETSTERNFNWYESLGYSVYETSNRFGFQFNYYRKDLS